MATTQSISVLSVTYLHDGIDAWQLCQRGTLIKITGNLEPLFDGHIGVPTAEHQRLRIRGEHLVIPDVDGDICDVIVRAVGTSFDVVFTGRQEASVVGELLLRAGDWEPTRPVPETRWAIHCRVSVNVVVAFLMQCKPNKSTFLQQQLGVQVTDEFEFCPRT